jgi:iron complex transport system substrate-binding protein
MRALIPLLLLAGCAQPPAGGGGIVSLNPCADALLVRLVSAARIAAISHYSQEAGGTSMSLSEARRYRATAGTAEEVIALAPDLVLASSFTAPATRDAFARAGLRTLYLDAPQTIAASERQVREVAAAVGAPARGEAVVGAIERAVAAASCADPVRVSTVGARAGCRDRSGPPVKALLYIYGDLATGSGTLLDEMMTRAGFTNAAAAYGLAYTGTLAAETILARPPDVVIAPEGGRQAAQRRRLLPHTRVAAFDRRLVNCGGPVIVPAMRRLAAIRRGEA